LKPVGIIPNPASGKDIRRMVAYGSVFDNNEKVNIVKRVILGLDSMGVREIVFMPDYFGIGVRAMENLDVSLTASFLDMQTENTQEDSARAAEMMRDLGVACIVTLGGDGTNRVVAKTCRYAAAANFNRHQHCFSIHGGGNSGWIGCRCYDTELGMEKRFFPPGSTIGNQARLSAD